MEQGRSPKVRQILRLQRRASMLRAGYDGAIARVAGSRHRAGQAAHQARALRLTLTPSELAQLRRARGV